VRCRIRDTVEFYSGDLAQLVNARLRRAFPHIWFVERRRVLRVSSSRSADEVRYSIVPILIGMDQVLETLERRRPTSPGRNQSL
jgi:hypothetical protein